MTTTATASPELLDLNRMSFLTGTIAAAPMLATDIVMHDLRITKAGIVYKGEEVNDAGAVHAALMDVLVRGAPLPPRAQPEGEARCVICGSTEARSGTCGSDDPRALCKAAGKPEGEAPQAELRSQMAYIAAYDPDELDGGHTQDGMRAACRLKLIIERARAALATLSPLCGAQHAESGKEVAVAGWEQRLNAVAPALRVKTKEQAMEAEIAAWRTLAAQQAAAPGALAGRIISATPGMSIIEVKIDRGALPEWLDPGYQVHVSSTAPSAPGTPEAPQTAAARDVLAERQRQMQVEGWTLAHDDQYRNSELAHGAAAYVLVNDKRTRPACWPWAAEWWKPLDDRRNLVRAGALVLAEIERLDRAAAPKGGV